MNWFSIEWYIILIWRYYSSFIYAHSMFTGHFETSKPLASVHYWMLLKGVQTLYPLLSIFCSGGVVVGLMLKKHYCLTVDNAIRGCGTISALTQWFWFVCHTQTADFVYGELSSPKIFIWQYIEMCIKYG